MLHKSLILSPPLGLSDEDAYAFRCFLYDLAEEFERHYGSQIERYLFPDHNQGDLFDEIDEHDEPPPF